MIRDLIFVETARAQFEALTKRHQVDVSEALLKIIQGGTAAECGGTQTIGV